MKISEIDVNKITDEMVDKIIYSGLEYENQHLDVAIILGSSKAALYRVPYAVREYKEDRIDKIIVSGGKIDGNGTSESEVMKPTAIEMGVLEKDIIVENKAMSTPENILFSKKIMKQKKMLQEGMNIGIVTTAYHMRRSIKIAERIFEKDNVNIIPLPGQDNSSRRDTWYKSEKGRNIVIGELKKIIYYIRQGIIDDFEV